MTIKRTTTDFADCDHVAAATAIANGAKHHTPSNPLFLIHTSGTGILTVEDQRAKTYGIERPKEYNDWEGVEELTHHLPDDAFHRNVDKIILEIGRRSRAQADGAAAVKTAIVCPCTIYGPGRGPGNTRSQQAYLLAEAVLKRKKGLLVGEGKNIWHQVHVQDLSEVYLALGEEAAASLAKNTSGGGRQGKATWGDEGYYFAENGSFCWGDIQREVARVAHEKGFIPSPDVEVLDAEQVRAINKHGLYAWGSNSRGHAIRARKLLGWKPSRPSLMELIPDIVDLEAKRLGLI